MTNRDPAAEFTMPPLEWVRDFEAAARLGSFTAAAAETGLTQSAISQRIGHLEKRLGAELFHRRPRSITLTLEGEAWLPHVRNALEGLRDSSEALFGGGRKRLVFSASQSINDLWLLPRLRALQEATGSQINVQTMVVGAHEAPQDDILRIRYGTGDWPHEYKLRLYSEWIVPVAAPALVAQGGNWTDWPRLSCSGPRPGWRDWAAAYGIPTTPVARLRFDTFLTTLGAAKAGLGVMLASLPLVEADLAAGRLVRLEEVALKHHESYWLLGSRDALSRRQWQAVAGVMSE